MYVYMYVCVCMYVCVYVYVCVSVCLYACNWQLAVLPQPGGREFDPHRVHDNLSVPLRVYMCFPVPEHQN